MSHNTKKPGKPKGPKTPDKPVNHDLESLRVVFVYLNFAARMGNTHISHIGLGNAAFMTSTVLKANGIDAEVWAVAVQEDIAERLEKDVADDNKPITHIIISAPWVQTRFLAELCHKYKYIQFIVNSHSAPYFLSADLGGIERLRQGAVLQQHVSNFRLSGNSTKFADWATIAWDVPVAYLPNLYNLQDMTLEDHRPDDGILRLASFGAIRPLKNQITAAATAVEIGKRLNVYTEFWLNSGRNEGGGFGVKAIQDLTKHIDGFRLRFLPWSLLNSFRKKIGKMDLLILPSATESFCMVCADGVFESVPSVVSSVITWAPDNWKGILDDPNNLADIGIELLNHRKREAKSGQRALSSYVEDGIIQWVRFLTR